MAESEPPLKEEIVLKQQTMALCKIKVYDCGKPFSGSFMIAKKNPDPSSKTAVLKEKEAQTGMYEFMIDPGEYIVSISKPGIKEKKEELIVSKGINETVIEIGQAPPEGYDNHKSPEKPSSGKLDDRPGSRQRPTSSKGRYPDNATNSAKTNPKGKLETIPQENTEDIPSHHEQQKKTTGSEVSHQEESKQKEGVKSALVKKVEVCVLDLDTGKPVMGVKVKLDEISFQGTTDDQGKCLVPSNKLNRGKIILDHNNYFGVVEEYAGENGLKAATQKKFNLVPKPKDIQQMQLRFIPGNHVPCAKFSILFDTNDESCKKDFIIEHDNDGKERITLNNLTKKHGVFRIVAEVTNIQEFINPHTSLMICHYEDCNQISASLPSDAVKKGPKLIWDVGFFADPAVNPQFVEINTYSNQEITLHSSLKEYQMLLNYLHNSKSDLKTLLGFKDKSKIEKNGDIFISKKTIYTSLDNYGLEIKNIDHLFSSACNSEGLYSYKECERRFGSLKPPFNFVKDAPKDKNATGEESGDEEILFEDDK